ncbi:MAG: DNA methyltransferase [Candidatus Sumerlaeia bacterium]|nr:DNA methyltransferase [Candidatus Sumerlaeia bacterium]
MSTHKIIFADSRAMPELPDRSVHLVVTSPPYWQIKDYGAADQIGFHDDYRAYINNLNLVWEECARVLHDGCRLCVNIGDQFARAAHYGRYKVIPIREEIVGFCEKKLGLDYMGAIIWQKVTTCNTSGGAAIMGSFPFPRNGIIKIDYEFIVIFKKPGKAPPPPSLAAKEAARLTTEEWNEYFYGHWNFSGVRQGEHPAAFPLELPRRLIRMFTFAGETVLDPFLGSGTTSLAAHRLGRNSVGYEINPEFRATIENRMREGGELFNAIGLPNLEFIERSASPEDFEERIRRWSAGPAAASGSVQIRRAVDPRENSYGTRVTVKQQFPKKKAQLKTVLSPAELLLRDGRTITLLGVAPWPSVESKSRAQELAIEHLERMVRSSGLELSNDHGPLADGASGPAYVHLSNKKFLNARMIRDGYARADRSHPYRHRKRFEQYEAEAREKRKGLWREHSKECES